MIGSLAFVGAVRGLGRSWTRYYVLFLTYRYLMRPLSLVAIVVLMFAVAALVVAPSVMNGFQAEFHSRVRGTLSDITLSCEMPFAITRHASLEKQVAAVPGVSALGPFLENPAIDTHLSKIDYCFMRGVEPRAEEKVSDFAKFIQSPRQRFLALMDYDTLKGDEKEQVRLMSLDIPDTVDREAVYKLLEEGDPDRPGVPTCLVGIFFYKTYEPDITLKRTRRTLGTIKLTTASDTAEKRDRELAVVGTFQTGFFSNDRRTVYMSLRNAQELVAAQDRVTGYSVKLDDYKRANEVREAIKEVAANAVMDGQLPRRGNYVKTWEEKDENLLRAVGMEKLLIRIMTGLIVVAASASIFLVLIMTAFMKVRELGILRAVGASRFGVFGLFVGQGLLIASIAMGLGCGLGILLSNYINEAAAIVHKLTGWHPFPPEVYYLERIPTKIVPREIGEDFVATLVLGVVFALIPATIAALRPPIRSIRYE